MGTYVQGIRRVVCGDGRVRGTFNLHGTETGRLSSKEPNMQNIPRNKLIKNEFVAKGYTLQLDSQAELRVLAYLSQDPFLLKAYQNDEDLHGQLQKTYLDLTIKSKETWQDNLDCFGEDQLYL